MSATPLSRTTPESQGVSSSAILAFLDGVAEAGLDLHSLMVLRHGSVIAEGWWKPYRREDLHLLYSLSKSFTSTAIGLAVSEGRLSVDDPVVSFFPDDVPAEPSENLKAMRVRHLLSMSTGQEADNLMEFYASEDGNWIKAFLARPVPYEPGTRFMYNSGATYALSAILQKITGKTVLAYLRPRLLDPLGIDKATWENDPRGINVGGWGMSVTTEAIARFGQLYLQGGLWEGRPLVPAGWIAEATRKHVSNGDDPNSDWAQGYGYQFWRSRQNAYRGDGAFGQYCVVAADQDMVVAITASVGDMQAVLNLIWENLLPAATPSPLPDSPAGVELRDRLASLEVALPQGPAHGIGEVRFESPRDETLTLRFVNGDAHLTLSHETGYEAIPIGGKDWLEGSTQLERWNGAARVASKGGWTEDGIYVAEIRYVESPQAATFRFDFSHRPAKATLIPRGRFGPIETTEYAEVQ